VTIENTVSSDGVVRVMAVIGNCRMPLRRGPARGAASGRALCRRLRPPARWRRACASGAC